MIVTSSNLATNLLVDLIKVDQAQQMLARHGIRGVDLARGVEEEQERLDAVLSEVSVGWPVHRMSAVDRTILRLALYEMLYVEDVPPDVAVNEAVELARGFSGEEAPAFVGGVLRGAGLRTHGEVGHGNGA